MGPFCVYEGTRFSPRVSGCGSQREHTRALVVSEDKRQDVGRAGERAAKKHLKHCGYRILATNYTCAAGEIDIICQDDTCIVFVEVKALTDDTASDPESKIGTGKQKRLLRSARYWLAAHGEPDCAYRFDAIGVIMPPGGSLRIRHIQEAFVPSN